jgi:hypothetical protein
MRHRLMHVHVFVMLGDVQPHSNAHQNSSKPERRCDGLAIQDNRDRRTDERCGGEIGAGTCRAEVSQRHYEQDQADPIPEKAKHERTGP